ncbi:hypothetical protein DFH06DRAFT_1183383 [Mycena polygramma]|nr:hypothetical protein DFH06DRAFT_1183383 [Mycena polygramma]
MDLCSTSPDSALKQETSAAEKISAYYSLVFPTVTFYVRTLSVTIGRRCIQNANLATSSALDSLQVDVDLGALKSVSRLHAKIEYDQEEDRFMLLVIGRNGAWVDGVWSASGTRAPLGERSQIQIASRTFHFVLPPPPPPEDTPSPSSQSSNARLRSPSVDITSISPPSTPQSHSPPPADTKPPSPPPEPQLPTPKPAAGKTNSKKRKKPEQASPPKPKAIPAEIPEKPSLTLRQLIQLAINDLGGKATLQEICTWIMNGYEHYQHVDDKWMSSVRHTLSSDKHFKKMERCGGTRGKGFFWSVDEEVDEQSTTQSTAVAPSKGSKGTKKKEKPSDSPTKKNGKGDAKGELPPLLTTTPRDVKPPILNPPAQPPAVATPAPAPTLTAAAAPPPSQVTTGVFAYSTLSSSSSYQNPYASLTQGNWGLSSAAASTPSTTSAPTPAATAPPLASSSSSSATVAAGQPGPQTPDVSIPIILGPIPPTHPDYAPAHPNNSMKEGYMVLHERTLILDPDVFSGVDGEMLKELEKMGARKALSVLAGHMVRALKERRAARGRARGRGRGRGLPKRRGDPPLIHSAPTSRPLLLADGTAPSSSGEKDKVPANVDAPSPVPVPVFAGTTAATGNGRAESPLVVVDDSDDEDRPAAKRRKLEDEPSDAVISMVV